VGAESAFAPDEPGEEIDRQACFLCRSLHDSAERHDHVIGPGLGLDGPRSYRNGKADERWENYAAHVLAPFKPPGYRLPMHDAGKLTPADPSNLAAELAYALRYQGRKRVHNANETMVKIVAKPAGALAG
jgi:hypothetical protein